MNANKSTDNPIRMVSAHAMPRLTPSVSVLFDPRIMWRNASARLPKMATNAKITMYVMYLIITL